MRLQDKRAVYGIDTDRADELIENGYVRDMLNCMVTSTNGEDSIVTNVKGTVNLFAKFGFQLPIGQNKCIGTYTSKDATQFFWFNWNSENNHGVYLYDGTSIRVLLEGDLGWSEDKSIHSIAFLGEQLSWAEGVEKMPRSININRVYNDISEFFISLAKTPPVFPLVIDEINTSVAEVINLFKDRSYYFTYRFVYKDGQQSVFAPYSKLTSSAYSQTLNSEYVKVFVNRNQLEGYCTPSGLKYNSEISSVEFAFAETYTGPFKLINTVDVKDVLDLNGWVNLPFNNECILKTGSQELGIKYNYQTASSILDSTETSKPFDSIFPSECLTTVDNRIILANTKEGFELPEIKAKNITQGQVELVGIYVNDSSTFGVPTSATVKGNYMCMKPKSRYGLGIVYYNEYGQKSGVAPLVDIKIPADFKPKEYNEWVVNFELDGTPPDWATHYQIVRTDNQTCSRFTQGVTNDVRFIRGYDENGDPIIISKIIGTSYQSSNSTLRSRHVLKEPGWFSDNAGEVSKWFYDNQPIYEGGLSNDGYVLGYFEIIYDIFGGIEGVVRLGDNIGTSNDGYPITFEGNYASGPNQGLPVRSYSKQGLDEAIDIWIDIYNWNNNTKLKNKFNPSNETPYVFETGDKVDCLYNGSPTYVGLLDMDIKDFKEGRYVVVKYQKDFLDFDVIGAGAFIEIWTPRSSDNETFYYEYGECYPINNPKTNQREHSKKTFSLWEGDTHRMIDENLYATESVYKYNFYSMNPSPRRRTGIWEKANGRPNLILKNGNNEVIKYNTIRWSDKLVDGSKINGTSTFDEFNSIQLDFDFGGISKITGVEEVLIANCESETALIYVNESLLKSAENEGIVAVSDNVLNSPKKLPGGFGCIHPESVTMYNNYLYWYSDNKKAAIRFNTSNGVFNISGGYNTKSYFFNKISNKWIGGFDPRFRIQLFCSDESIGFLDPIEADTPNAWVGRYSFVPERFGYIGIDLLSLKNGVLWEHYSSDIYNNFYGEQFASEITPVFNLQPSDMKIFNAVSLESNEPFTGYITTQEGQNTRIVEMEKINNEWWSDILCDETSGTLYDGDFMTSQTLKIKFIYDKISKFRLRYINLYSQVSQLTNK